MRNLGCVLVDLAWCIAPTHGFWPLTEVSAFAWQIGPFGTPSPGVWYLGSGNPVLACDFQ